MISFIVIGRNEGVNLEKCLKSIHNAIKLNKLKNYEIIYVDSNSTDESLNIAKKNDVDKIYLLTEEWNAAIGRNIGALNAEGDIFCFLDGDMELQSSFVPLVIDGGGNLKYDLVAGNLIQVYYDEQNKKVKEEIAFKNVKKSLNKPITGGAFFIKSKIYNSVNGMDNRFKRSEDPELGLRLAKKGILLTFLPDIFVRHHTCLLGTNKLHDLKKREWLYGNLLIYKLNLFNKYTWKRMIKNDSSLLVLALSLVCSLFFNKIFILLYPLSLLFRVKPKWKNRNFDKFIYLLFRDLLVLISFIPYYKKTIKTDTINYTTIKE